jgi:P27 family predicted phage terminase small subunit
MRRTPRPPKQLSREARSWWNRIVSGWVVDTPGLLILESALEAFDTMRRAQEQIRVEGQTVKDRFDQLRAHPAVAIERDAKGVLLRHLKSLGLELEPLNDAPGRLLGR